MNAKQALDWVDKNTIIGELKALPHYFSFIRWLSVKIDIAELEATIDHTESDLQFATYTPESLKIIYEFAKDCGAFYVESHKNDQLAQSLTLEKILVDLTELWQREQQEIVRIRAIPT